MANKTVTIHQDRVIFFAGYISAFKNNAEKEVAIEKIIKDYSATMLEVYMASNDKSILEGVLNPVERKKPGVKAKVKPEVKSTFEAIIEPIETTLPDPVVEVVAAEQVMTVKVAGKAKPTK